MKGQDYLDEEGYLQDKQVDPKKYEPQTNSNCFQGHRSIVVVSHITTRRTGSVWDGRCQEPH